MNLLMFYYLSRWSLNQWWYDIFFSADCSLPFSKLFTSSNSWWCEYAWFCLCMQVWVCVHIIWIIHDSSLIILWRVHLWMNENQSMVCYYACDGVRQKYYSTVVSNLLVLNTHVCVASFPKIRDKGLVSTVGTCTSLVHKAHVKLCISKCVKWRPIIIIWLWTMMYSYIYMLFILWQRTWAMFS